MKTVSLFCLFALVALCCGCSIAEQDASAVGTQLQEGLQGRGKIVPNDPMGDSFGSDYQ